MKQPRSASWLVILLGVLLGGSHVLGLPTFFLTAEEERFADEFEQQNHRELERCNPAKRIRSNKAQANRTRSILRRAQWRPFSYITPSLISLRSIPPNLRI